MSARATLFTVVLGAFSAFVVAELLVVPWIEESARDDRLAVEPLSQGQWAWVHECVSRSGPVHYCRIRAAQMEFPE